MDRRTRSWKIWKITWIRRSRRSHSLWPGNQVTHFSQQLISEIYKGPILDRVQGEWYIIFFKGTKTILTYAYNASIT